MISNELDPRPDPRADTGQAAVLVVTVAAVLLVTIAAALVTVGRTSIDRTRAQTAADAAALASVDGDRTDASRLAEAHGATLVSWEPGPGPHEVTVTVTIGAVSAVARASSAP